MACCQSDIAWPQTEKISATVKDVNKKIPEIIPSRSTLQFHCTDNTVVSCRHLRSFVTAKMEHGISLGCQRTDCTLGISPPVSPPVALAPDRLDSSEKGANHLSYESPQGYEPEIFPLEFSPLHVAVLAFALRVMACHLLALLLFACVYPCTIC